MKKLVLVLLLVSIQIASSQELAKIDNLFTSPIRVEKITLAPSTNVVSTNVLEKIEETAPAWRLKSDESFPPSLLRIVEKMEINSFILPDRRMAVDAYTYTPWRPKDNRVRAGFIIRSEYPISSSGGMRDGITGGVVLQVRGR